MIELSHIDHIVLTVRDIERTCAFYQQVLGCDVVTFGKGRVALEFGVQKINLHQSGKEFEPKAECPTAGSADLCFIVRTPFDEVLSILDTFRVAVEAGPVERTGANGPITSIYVRDPDRNLIELSRYHLSTI